MELTMIRTDSLLGETEVSGSGWVGVTDSLIGILVLLIAITLASVSQLNTAEIQLNNAKSELNEKELRINQLLEEIDKNEKTTKDKKDNLALLREKESKWNKTIEGLKKTEEELRMASKNATELRKELNQIESRLKETEAINIKLRLSEKELITKLNKTNDDLFKSEQKNEQFSKDLKLNKDTLLKLAGEIQSKNNDLNKANSEIDGLRLKVGVLATILKSFNSTEINILATLNKFKKDIDINEGMLKVLRSELEKLRTEMKFLDDVLVEFKLKPNEISAELRKLNRDLKDSSGELRIAKKELDQLHRKQEHAKLLGIKGDLKTVAIVVDFSGSMDYSLDNFQESEVMQSLKDVKTQSRWEITKDMIATFCELLDMEECILIVFNNSVSVYDRKAALDKNKIILINNENNDGSLTNEDISNLKKITPFRLRANESDRTLLTGIANNLGKPSGGTNTLKALSAAYQLSPDSILLFTDGAPGLETPLEQSKEQKLRGEFPKPPDFDKHRNQIYELLKQHKSGPPINVIGIGYYFEPELSNFLKTLAKQTKGSFQGR